MLTSASSLPNSYKVMLFDREVELREKAKPKNMKKKLEKQQNLKHKKLE